MAKIKRSITTALGTEKHVNVPGGQSARRGSNLAASGLCKHVTAEAWHVSKHVTAPRAGQLLTTRPARHTQPAASREDRLAYCIPTAREVIRPGRLRPCYLTLSTLTLISATRSSSDCAVPGHGVITAAHGRPPAALARARSASHQP